MPLITSFEVSGFRAIPPDQSLRLRMAPLTLLIGPNSTAKSSLVEIMAKIGVDIIGTTEDTFKGLGYDVTVRAELKFSPASEEVIDEAVKRTIRQLSNLYKTFGLHGMLGKLLTPQCHNVLEKLISSILLKSSLRLESRCGLEGEKLTCRHKVKVTNTEPESIKLTLRKCMDKSSAEAYNDVLSILEKSAGEASIQVIRLATRFVPAERLLDGIIRLDSDLGRLMYIYYPEPDVRERLLRWLNLSGNYTGLRVIPKPQADSIKVEVYDGYAGAWIELGHTAGGLRFSLPVLLALASARRGDIVLIDDVELGLHPAAQRRVAEAIIETVQRGVQVVATTHSPVVLGRVLLAVYRNELQSHSTAINLLYRDLNGVYAEPIEPKVPLRVSERAERALRETGAVGVFGEAGEIALEIAELAG